MRTNKKRTKKEKQTRKREKVESINNISSMKMRTKIFKKYKIHTNEN